METNSVSMLISLVKKGDNDAATDLWNKYYCRLVALARSKLGLLGRRVADEDDVVLQAFASFCRRAESGDFPDLQDRDDLWRLLICIAERKASNERRHASRKKNQAIPESALGYDNAGLGLDILGSEDPSPEFVVVVADEVASLLNQLDDPIHRSICVQKMEGLTNKAIANSLGCSVSSVERKLRLIRSLLNTREDDDDAGRDA